MKIIKQFGNLAVTLIASVALILVSLMYFIITLWIVKAGAAVLGYTIDGNWAVLSASLISVGSIIGSSLQK